MPAAILLTTACTLEILVLVDPGIFANGLNLTMAVSRWFLALTPWLAYGQLRRTRTPSDLDRLWLDFRDRFGFVWGQRLREQFNRSAAHAGWPIYLGWQGFRTPSGAAFSEGEISEEIRATLRALMKRFGPETETGPTSPAAARQDQKPPPPGPPPPLPNRGDPPGPSLPGWFGFFFTRS